MTDAHAEKNRGGAWTERNEREMLQSKVKGKGTRIDPQDVHGFSAPVMGPSGRRECNSDLITSARKSVRKETGQGPKLGVCASTSSDLGMGSVHE